MQKAKESSQTELNKSQPISVVLSSEIRREFKSLHKVDLRIVREVASKDGKSTTFYFDVSHCQTRQDIVVVVQNIMNAAYSIIEGRRNQHDNEYLDQVYQNLKDIDYLSEDRERLSWISGQQLIEKGIANCFNEVSGRAKFWDKVLRFFLGKENPKLTYTYFGKIVDPSKIYVVANEKPVEHPEPKPIDHKDNINKHYEYGEQIAAGYGVKMVEQYQQHIITINNNIYEQHNQEANE